MVDTNIKLRNAGFMSKTGQAHSYTSDIELVIFKKKKTQDYNGLLRGRDRHIRKQL